MELKQVAEASPVSKIVFDMFSARERFRRRSDLRRMHSNLVLEGKQISYDDFLTVFENLQDAGVGRIVVGRKNNPDRFLWNYNIKEVAQRAKQGVSVEALEPLPVAIRKRTRKVKRQSKVIAKPTESHSVSVKQMDNYTQAKKNLTDTLNINITLSPQTRPEDVTALLGLLNEMQAKK